MKNLLVFLIAFTLCSFAPEASEPVKIGIPAIVAILTGVWEVVGRIIPSVGQITIIGKVIEGLNWLSNFLNRKK